MEAIREQSVPELAEIKKHFSCIDGAAGSESNEEHFAEVCKLIANSYNMVDTFKQALACAESMKLHSFYLHILRSLTDINVLDNFMTNFCPPGTMHAYN